MQIQVLGPLRLVLPGADVDVDLGPPKQRALLALLALRAGEWTSTDLLIDCLWGGRPPRSATHAVQVYVSDLRRRLGGEGRRLEYAASGYVLRISPEDVDASRFEQLVTDGRAALRSGISDQAISCLQAGLLLWRGPVLEGLPGEGFAGDRVASLTAHRVEASELLCGAWIDNDEPTDAIRLLTEVIGVDPLRERPRELLMRALYLAGRHAEALQAYLTYRDVLGDSLGIAPSPELRRVYEQVLLHDPALLGPRLGHRDGRGTTSIRNPFKGLRPFAAEDAEDFFGREALICRVVEELNVVGGLVTLVGPSGSGKSSVVHAGVLPRLAATDTSWRAMEIGVTPAGLAELESPTSGNGAELGRTLLVLDQFEEVFLDPDPQFTGRFLRALSARLSGSPDVVAVATLRADCYDKPLEFRDFADLFLTGVVTVLPMSAEELQDAIVAPAARQGVTVLPALLAALLADAARGPGTLPLLQYTLTELFDRRQDGAVLTIDAYYDSGGLAGALQRRSEHVYQELAPAQQEVAVHLLLLLIRVRPGEAPLRRRITLSGLLSTGIEPVALSQVLQGLVTHRLLTVDFDPRRQEATVELAHESLISGWQRYAALVEAHRISLADRDRLEHAADEWEQSGRHPDYLLHGHRLARYTSQGWDRRLVLTAREQDLVAESVAEAGRQQDARTAGQRASRRRRRRVWWTAAATAAGIAAAAGLVGVRIATPPPDDHVALLYHGSGTEVDDAIREGFDLAAVDYDVAPSIHLADPEDAEQQLRKVAADDPDLLLVQTIQTDVTGVAAEHPDTHFVVYDQPSTQPNVTSVVSQDEEGAFLAGAAAALVSESGKVGFIGGVRGQLIERFEAGYTAGGRTIDPEIDVLVAYLSTPPDYEGFVSVDRGLAVARQMYDDGADVVFAAAGESGLGVIEAAAAESTATRHLWAIGVDSDQYETVQWLPGVVEPARWQAHILTSVTKSLDANIYDVVADHSRGRLKGGVREVGIASGAVDLSWSGGYLETHRATLEALREQIVKGELLVPDQP